MKNLILTIAVRAALSAAIGGTALAGPSRLAFRLEPAISIYNGATTQTLDTVFGTNAATLSFAGTTTYDFYSPPLAASASVSTSDRASGLVTMANNSASSANDFTVVARMLFYDYDPVSGLNSLIIDTTDSSPQLVRNGRTASCSLPKIYLPQNRTLSAGHSVHIAVTVTLVSGNPGSFGQFLYNAPQDSGTEAWFPQNNTVTWQFSSGGSSGTVPSTRLYLARQTDGSSRLTCTSTPGQTYSVQATANLAAPQWTTIGSGTVDTNGNFSFTDTNAPQYSARFYRLSQ